jgi:hypothetical protein
MQAQHTYQKPGLGCWLKAVWNKLAEEQEWRGLAGEDRHRIAQDMAMSDGDLAALVRDGGGSAELEELLARRAAAGKPRLAPELLREMQHNCAFCAERPDCRDWLAAHEGAGAPAFCPNRDVLGRDVLAPQG